MTTNPRVEALREARNVLANSGAESGYCMCGDPVAGHTIGSGHAPVDAHVYMASEIIAKIDTALASSGNEADFDAGGREAFEHAAARLTERSPTGDDKGLVERKDQLLIDLLRREGHHSGVWFRHRLLEAADRLTALSSGNEVAKVVGWQPIETAPKDGTPIIAVRDEWVRAREVAWYWDARSPDEPAAFRPKYSGGQPSHWMPLPAPPASDAAPLTGG